MLVSFKDFMNNDLSGEEANVLALDVLAKGHLQQGQSHVEGLDDVGLSGQRVVSEEDRKH